MLTCFRTFGDSVLIGMLAAGNEFLSLIRSRSTPRWLTLWGRNGYGNGTGKTFLARAIRDAARPFLAGTPATYLVSWPSLCERMQAREDTAATQAFAREAPLLVLDDIGAEHQTGAMLGKLHALLDARLRRWTIITTNLAPDDWADRDSRISSRIIRDGSRHVCCEATDFALRS